MKLPFKNLRARLTGIASPIFGAQWEFVENEREIIRQFLTELEDRRVLYVPAYLEVPGQVEESVVQIRGICTDTLKRLAEDSPAAQPVRAMRAACRSFLNDHEHRFANASHYHRYHGGASDFDADFFVRLGELRATFGQALGSLLTLTELAIEEDLASLLPAADENPRLQDL